MCTSSMKYMMHISLSLIFLDVLMSAYGWTGCRERCNDLTVSASLKSDVLLPCHLKTENELEMVKWSYFPKDLLTIRRDGKINFYSPREGRVNAFPLLSRGGNFTILIKDLQLSDLGTYCCEMRNECWTVKITKEESQNNSDFPPWLYFIAGAGLFLFVFAAFCSFSHFCVTGNCMPSSSINSNAVTERNEGNNSLDETLPVDRSHPKIKMRGQSKATTVYENDQPAVNLDLNPVQNCQRANPEPLRELAFASSSYYVNQEEIDASGNVGEKHKKKKNYQIRNPLYDNFQIN